MKVVVKRLGVIKAKVRVMHGFARDHKFGQAIRIADAAESDACKLAEDVRSLAESLSREGYTSCAEWWHYYDCVIGIVGKIRQCRDDYRKAKELV